MSYSPDQLLTIVANYEQLATKSLVVTAKKKEKKKLDPKAKVRNRGTVCVPAESAKDKKDHFPINDEGQARNALARVQQLSSAPWYKGSLEGLKALVARKVKAKYPKIDVGGKKEKKSSLEAELLSLGQSFQETDANKLADLAYKHQTSPRPFGAGGQAGSGQAWLDNLFQKQEISQKQHDDATNLLRSMLAAGHPRKASLEYIESLLKAYAQ